MNFVKKLLGKMNGTSEAHIEDLDLIPESEPEPADPPKRTKRWRKDPDGLMKSRVASELRPGNDLRPEIERGSFIKYADECPGEGWVEAGYAEGNEVQVPFEEEKEARESVVNVTSGFMKRKG